ncbi:TIGR00730 family Rossman fold protein [Lacticaseibacillus absianus]|uniref:LOG family protein n=1 Tax=Lacticaseibacillus absianus TaxID=2729623 RepID=UPI001C534F94|nr:TIGR00730 family Rossman fold protein [Lacticaseibacillus absianus]
MKIAVFCGASAGNASIYTAAAEHLGRWLVAYGHTLVYGGGGVGLMGILGRTVLANGGQVIGIMPTNLYARGAALAGLEVQQVPDMAIRKQRMLALAEGCIALPGGPGTLEEITEAFSWARIGDNASPCAFYNVAGYWDPLAQMFDRMVEADFLTAADRRKLCFAAHLTPIAAFMRAYTPPAIRTYPTAGA